MEEAKSASKWYNVNKNVKKRWSKRIRFFSIALFGIGGLFPLINALISEWEGKFSVLNLGYISIALAGTLLLFDRFFGLSSGWIRYITTEMEINRRIKEFELKWAIETYEKDLDGLDPEEAKVFLRLLQDFIGLINELVKTETNAWAAEFQSNMAELQNSINNRINTLIPGSIKVNTKNAKKFKNLKIWMDNLETFDLKGPVHLFREVSTGYHLITVSGENIDSGQFIESAEVAHVEPGKMAEVSMEL